MGSTESSGNHGTETCQVSARSVEVVAEAVDELIRPLVHIGNTEVAIALLVTAHRLASDDGTAVDLHDRHQRLLCETGEMFECSKCGTIKLTLALADEEQPGVCDVCDAEAAT